MARTKQTVHKTTKKTPTPPSNVGACVDDKSGTPVVNDAVQSLATLGGANGGNNDGNTGSGKRKAADDTTTTLISHDDFQLFCGGLHGTGDGIDEDLLCSMGGDEIAGLLALRDIDFHPSSTREELLNILNRNRYPIPTSLLSRFRIVQLPEGKVNLCASVQGSLELLVVSSVSDSYAGDTISVGEAFISFDYVPVTSVMAARLADRLFNGRGSLQGPAVIGVLSPVSLSPDGGSRKKGKSTSINNLDDEETQDELMKKEIAEVSKPKQPLNRYNLFYRYKKKALDNYMENNPDACLEGALAIINAVVGTEGVQGTDSMSPDALDQIRSSNIRSLLENDLQSHDTSKRVHRASSDSKSVLGFVELGKAMSTSWKNVDAFAKGVFKELSEEGKEASGYSKRFAAYQKKVKEIKTRFAENGKKKQEAPISSKPNTPKVNQAAADSQVISPDIPVNTTTTKEVSSFSIATAAAEKTEPAKEEEMVEEKEPAKDKETVEEEDFPTEGKTVQMENSVMVVLLKSANEKHGKVNDKVTTLEENAQDVGTKMAYTNSKKAIAKAKTILNKFGNVAVEMERTLKEEKAAEETKARNLSKKHRQSLTEIQFLKTKLASTNERNKVLETEKTGFVEEIDTLKAEIDTLKAENDTLKSENHILKQHEKEASFSDSEEEEYGGYQEVRAKMGN